MQNPSLLLSLEWPADLLIVDKSSGRAMARNLNIGITGTLGVLLKAKRDGELPSLKFEVDRLVQNAGFSSRTVSARRFSSNYGSPHEYSASIPHSEILKVTRAGL